MRIRSIKPEFWTSEDISRLGYFDRLLFIALWSYVDDNGVGVDRVPLIIGDLFPEDMSRGSHRGLHLRWWGGGSAACWVCRCADVCATC